MDSLLGEGGMGAVYDALDLRIERRVAVKLLHSHLLHRTELVERFLREARAVGRIGHANIVQVSDVHPLELVDAVNTSGDVYLVMEHLQGETLGAAIEKHGALPPKRVARITLQLLSAIGAAHKAEIVHRDLKPENVFLISFAETSDVVKVLDFGIAKLFGKDGVDKLTQTGMMIGTPAYMSPEQMRGEPADARADIYAIGACMYHALSGRMPFEGTSMATLMVAVLQETPPSLDALRVDLPRKLVSIVERALSKQAHARFATADEMAAAIGSWLSEEERERPSSPAFMPHFSPASPPSVLQSNVGQAPRVLTPLPVQASSVLSPPSLLQSSLGRPADTTKSSWSEGQAPPKPSQPWTPPVDRNVDTSRSLLESKPTEAMAQVHGAQMQGMPYAQPQGPQHAQMRSAVGPHGQSSQVQQGYAQQSYPQNPTQPSQTYPGQAPQYAQPPQYPANFAGAPPTYPGGPIQHQGQQPYQGNAPYPGNQPHYPSNQYVQGGAPKSSSNLGLIVILIVLFVALPMGGCFLGCLSGLPWN